MQSTAVADTNSAGAFVRLAATYRSGVSKDGEFPPESGRYILYISLACPWANRTLAVLRLKGLEDVIALSIVHPVWARTRPDEDEHCGWQFRAQSDAPVTNPVGKGSFSCEGCVPDPLGKAKFVRDIYELDGGGAKRFTVPILFDSQTSRIVNNESSEIVRILNSSFNDFASNPSLDLYPEALRPAIDAVNDWVYGEINNGVYKCGFATTQAAYEEAFVALSAALDRVEAILASQRYIAGDALTEADIRLFQTLIRFDEVYAVYFKTNCRLIREREHTYGWLRELYQMPIGNSVNMAHIKNHYYSSHPSLNVHAIVPVGICDDFSAPHNREKIGPAAA